MVELFLLSLSHLALAVATLVLHGHSKHFLVFILLNAVSFVCYLSAFLPVRLEEATQHDRLEKHQYYGSQVGLTEPETSEVVALLGGIPVTYFQHVADRFYKSPERDGESLEDEIRHFRQVMREAIAALKGYPKGVRKSPRVRKKKGKMHCLIHFILRKTYLP